MRQVYSFLRISILRLPVFFASVFLIPVIFSCSSLAIPDIQKPSGLKLSGQIWYDRIELSWKNDPAAHYYRVYRRLDRPNESLPFQLIGRAEKPFYQDKDASPDTDYSYRIQAVSSRTSLFSESFRTKYSPLPPPDLTADLDHSLYNGVTQYLAYQKNTDAVKFTLKCSVSNTKIYYYLNDPAKAEEYTGDFTLREDGTLYYYTVYQNAIRSAIRQITFKRILNEVQRPVIKINNMTADPAVDQVLYQPQTVTLDASENQELYVTLNGETVSYQSPLSIEIKNSCIILIYYVVDGIKSAEVLYKFILKSEKPSFSVTPGTHTSPVDIELRHQAPQTKIYYSTQSGEHLLSSPALYQNIPFHQSNNSTLTIWMFAQTGEMDRSEIVQGSYKITGKLASPSISTPLTPDGSGYYITPSLEVRISNPNSQSDAYYTISGNTAFYSNPFSVSGTTTVYAYCRKDDWLNSDTVSKTFYLKVAQPSLSILEQTAEYEKIALSVNFTGAVIRYTLNGTDPTELNGYNYTGTLTIDKNCTLKAAAFRSGYVSSNIIQRNFSFRTPDPLCLQDKEFFETTQVSFTNSFSNVSYRYTTDGVTNPTATTGTLYTGPFTLTQNTTLRVIAFKPDITPSDPVIFTFKRYYKAVMKTLAAVGPEASVMLQYTYSNSQIESGTHNTYLSGYNSWNTVRLYQTDITDIRVLAITHSSDYVEHELRLIETSSNSDGRLLFRGHIRGMASGSILYAYQSVIVQNGGSGGGGQMELTYEYRDGYQETVTHALFKTDIIPAQLHRYDIKKITVKSCTWSGDTRHILYVLYMNSNTSTAWLKFDQSLSWFTPGKVIYSN